MWHFTAKIRRHKEDGGGDSFQVIDVKDHEDQPCGLAADLMTRYSDVVVLMESLTTQLEIGPENLTLVEERDE